MQKWLWLGGCLFLWACQPDRPPIPTLYQTATPAITATFVSPTQTLTPTSILSLTPSLEPSATFSATPSPTLTPIAPQLEVTNPVGAYIRGGAGMEYDILGEVLVGEIYPLSGYTNDIRGQVWYLIQHPVGEAWIAGVVAEPIAGVDPQSIPKLTVIIPTPTFLPAFTEHSTDYPAAYWMPADPLNAMPANRPDQQIDLIVLHTLQASSQQGVRFFSVPQNRGVHYIVSHEGEVIQMIRHADIARHTGHPETDGRSIAIEMEGDSKDPQNYTPALYQAVADLVRFLVATYNIPPDRQHIIGHNEVPGCPYSGGGPSCHSDPGRYWDWGYFMALVQRP